MATQIMLLLSVEGTKVTPYVTVNPYYNGQGFANLPKPQSSLQEGYLANNLHREVLDFANNLHTKKES